MNKLAVEIQRHYTGVCRGQVYTLVIIFALLYFSLGKCIQVRIIEDCN